MHAGDDLKQFLTKDSTRPLKGGDRKQFYFTRCSLKLGADKVREKALLAPSDTAVTVR